MEGTTIVNSGEIEVPKRHTPSDEGRPALHLSHWRAKNARGASVQSRPGWAITVGVMGMSPSDWPPHPAWWISSGSTIGAMGAARGPRGSWPTITTWWMTWSGVAWGPSLPFPRAAALPTWPLQWRVGRTSGFDRRSNDRGWPDFDKPGASVGGTGSEMETCAGSTAEADRSLGHSGGALPDEFLSRDPEMIARRRRITCS